MSSCGCFMSYGTQNKILKNKKNKKISFLNWDFQSGGEGLLPRKTILVYTLAIWQCRIYQFLNEINEATIIPDAVNFTFIYCSILQTNKWGQETILQKQN